MYVAGAEDAGYAPSADPPEPVESDPERDVTPARRRVRDQLRRSTELRSRGTKQVGTHEAGPHARVEATLEGPNASGRQRAPDAHATIGGHLEDLRVQASALVTAGRDSAALPLLIEIVALSPTNAWALKELVRYYQGAGMTTHAELYLGRLKAVAPY